MRKKYLLVLPLLALLGVTACGEDKPQGDPGGNTEEPGDENPGGNTEEPSGDDNPSGEEPGGDDNPGGEEIPTYFIVTYDYNYDGISNQKFVVNEEQNLNKPKNPKRADYVFAGWYTDEACTNTFDGFGKTVSEDFTLYAKWKEYASLTDLEKVTYFLDEIESYEGNVNNAYFKSTVGYAPIFITEEVYYMYLESDYTRYSDLVTIEDYGYLDETSSELTPTGITQLFKDGDTYYQLYKSLEDEANNQKASAPASQVDENKFYDIGVVNLELSSLTQLEDLLTNSPDNILDDPEVYKLDGLNITAFDSTREVSLNFSFSYSTVYSGQDGTLLQEVYDVVGNIQILNGTVHRSTISTATTTAVDGQAYLMTVEDNVVEYKTGDFEEFTGESFDPADFKEAEQY